MTNEKEKLVDNLVETLRKTADHLEEIDSTRIDRDWDRDFSHYSLNEIKVSSTGRKFKVDTSKGERIEFAVIGHPNLPPWLPELEL
jgi:hypothetical protein